MITKLVWANEFGDALSKSSTISLKDLCDLLSNVQDNDHVILKNEGCYTDLFSEWLYGREDEHCRDDKKLLSKWLMRSEEIDDSDYQLFCDLVRKKGRDDDLLMMIDVDEENVLCVYDLAHYDRARDYQLSHLVKENEYYDVARASFRNLYLHEGIRRNIRTMKVPFQREVELITKHLRALNDSIAFWEGQRKDGYVKSSKAFSIKTGVECSTENDRKSADKLRFAFHTEKGDEIVIVCELHTKLKFPDMNHKKQDRIYFHPPMEGVEQGRLLVAYIGEHL